MSERVIRTTAPVRICDLGGWTDTWFGAPGQVLNLAVEPGVEVTIEIRNGRGHVNLDLPAFGDRYEVVPHETRAPRNPLLEAAIDSVPPAGELDLDLTVRSGVAPGSGCGTSAAVAVAVLGALTAVGQREPDPHGIARAAHALEVEALGGESGVQDQVSSAFGGINYLEIDPYPESAVTPLAPWPEISSHLLLVFVGRAHESSAVHRQVIEGTGSGRLRAMQALRTAAAAGRDAVVTRDVNAFGRAMILNTGAQKQLHPRLIGDDARQVIEAVRRSGAIGWKVNGAGGDGGSLTLLTATAAGRDALAEKVTSLDPAYAVTPVRISETGLKVTRST